MELDLALAKKVTKIVVGQSVGFTIGNVIKNNATPENKLQKAELLIGSYVIGAAIGEKVLDYTSRQFDDIVDAVQKFKNRQNKPAN